MQYNKRKLKDTFLLIEDMVLILQLLCLISIGTIVLIC